MREDENVCEKCGKINLDFENGDRQVCPKCDRSGPWCEECLLHHFKHDDGEDDIEFNENCSDCDLGADVEGEDDLDGFIVYDE